MCKKLTYFVLACLLVLCMATASQAQDPHNVAVMGTATSSSTGWGWLPHMAIDGNIDSGSHSATPTAGEWLEIALDQPYDLLKISVVNRSSCCSERMIGNIIIVMDADRNVLYTSDPIAEAAAGSVHDFDNDGAGFAGVSIIRVEQTTDAYVQIMEVEAMITVPYAWAPVPADGEIEVDTTSLEWTLGDNAVSSKVYLSTDETIDDADLLGETALNLQVVTLDPGATYYWRVDEIDADGNVFAGDVWNFSTLPLEAHFPSPFDGAMWLSADTKLSWTAGKDAIMHNVHFGTDPAALLPVAMMQMDASFDPGPLELDTTYYWRVDEFALGVTNPGPVWSFSTMLEGRGGVKRETWDGIGTNNLSTLRNADAFPESPTVVDQVPDFLSENLGKDNYGGRLQAWLHVPVAGEYTFWVAGDDGHELYLGTGPNDAELIAGASSWSGQMDWDKYASQKSDPITLEEGVYYLMAMWKEGGGGDNCDAAWQGPAVPVRSLITAGFLTPYDGAWAEFAVPNDGAVDVTDRIELSFTPGAAAVGHDLYLGSDMAAVATGDASVYQGKLDGTTFTPAEPLDRGVTYYWRVDALSRGGEPTPSAVWSFRIIDRHTDNWATSVGLADAAYLNTFVQNGAYDIGELSGDISYEFIVNSNPLVTPSSALIGRIGYGDTTVALKYEQYENTGNYGATVFGVADHDYGVPAAPGEYTHLVFVSSEDAAATELYVNGELAGSVPTAITLSGVVGIGQVIRDPEGAAFFDSFDGTIFGLAIYDRALTADEIAASADKYFSPIPIEDPDLMVYYDFESGEGDLVIDRSGHSNHGLVMGDPQWVGGISGGAMEFDGDGDYVDSRYTEDLATYTIACWVKSPAAPSGDSPSGPLHREKNYQFNWNHGDETYQGAAAMNVGDWPAAKYGPVEADTWYFLTATFDGTSFKAYRDGIPITIVEVSAGPVPETGSMKIARHATAAQFFTGTVDEARVYRRALTEVEVLKLAQPELADVTAPGDTIQGVPNDGDWPGHEAPPNAIDDDTGTKYLHFKGGSMATGIQVEPAKGPTVVTGLTLTTANDDYGRDPTSFELSGSNESIDGPYELIASGDVVDFAQEALWPRFTTNATAITFDNAVAYKYYQVTFPGVTRPNNDGLMQIAEVELLGVPAVVGHWKFDDGAGDVAVDSSGNNNDGTVTLATWVEGIDGGALDMAGVGYVDVPAEAWSGIENEMTIAFWAYGDPAVMPQSHTVFAAYVDPDNNEARIASAHIPWGNGNVYFDTGGTPTSGGYDRINKAASAEEYAGQWRHWTFLKNAETGDQQIYLDGVLWHSGTGKTRPLTGVTAFTIGSKANHSEIYPGIVDDFRLYGQALSAMQIYKLANP